MILRLFRPVPAGRLFGIPLRVSPAVVLLALLVLLNAALAGAAAGSGHAPLVWAFLMLLVLAASLVLHELGHALCARRLGLEVRDITLWPFGGMARMEALAHRPGLEAPVAVAGPLVNLFLAALLAGLASLVPAAPGLRPGAADFLRQAAILNLILGAGNLLPAFPLDGGRILRAWLARSSPLPDATRAAQATAVWLAVAGLLLAASQGAFLLGLVLFLYIWWTGHLERLQVILFTGQAPRLPVATVYRRALASLRLRRRPRRSAPPGEGPALEVEAETEIEFHLQELERFHGSLREWFLLRRRR